MNEDIQQIEAQIEGKYLPWRQWWNSRWPLIVHKKRFDVMVAIALIAVAVAFALGILVG